MSESPSVSPHVTEPRGRVATAGAGDPGMPFHTGRGMSPEQLPDVFDAYWQAEPRGRKGVGLGLAIVQGIVQAHGGRIDVTSSLGVGSTFRFTLPTPLP
jgi:light-regulated signal transduction histidine kinase (bacteriophytochrome)